MIYMIKHTIYLLTSAWYLCCLPSPLWCWYCPKGERYQTEDIRLPDFLYLLLKTQKEESFAQTFPLKRTSEKRNIIYQKIKIIIWDKILSLEKCGVAVLQMHQLQKEAEKESPQYLAKKFGIGYKLSRKRQKSWRSLFQLLFVQSPD